MKAFVTGGNGFLGAELVRQLRAAGHEATAASRQTGVDILDPGGLRTAMAGHDIVFHVAALAGVWGRASDFERTNILGTENIVQAMRELGIGRLVYTSSPSVVFDGGDQIDATSTLPYPERFLADYPRTKAVAERRVLAANGPGLATVALRPHLIYGPGDPHLLPRLLARARAGRLRVVGSGENRVSLSFVENAAAAHHQAALALTGPQSPPAGRAFFVNDPGPVRLWDWLNGLFGQLGVAPVTRRVPAGVAYGAGAVAEAVWRLLGLSGEPPMTRFVALQLATHHTYSLAEAQQAFDYRPPVGPEEALARTVASLRTA